MCTYPWYRGRYSFQLNLYFQPLHFPASMVYLPSPPLLFDSIFQRFGLLFFHHARNERNPGTTFNSIMFSFFSAPNYLLGECIVPTTDRPTKEFRPLTTRRSAWSCLTLSRSSRWRPAAVSACLDGSRRRSGGLTET